MEPKLFPVFVDAVEADELCIQSGWYIGGDGALSTGLHTGNPFGGEKEAKDYIERGDLGDSYTSD